MQRNPSREEASRISRRRSGLRVLPSALGSWPPLSMSARPSIPTTAALRQATDTSSERRYAIHPILHRRYPLPGCFARQWRPLAKEHALDVQAEREPDLGFKTQWVQEHLNQIALLDCFTSHLKPEQSLCFFYAKQVPFVEDSAAGRILIGVGRVLHVGDAQEYAYTTKDLKGKLRAMLWERMVQHSIRPDFKNGFLLPYHAAIDKVTEDPDFDPAEIAAFSPTDRLIEFSHASQLVSHDGAIASLLACSRITSQGQGRAARAVGSVPAVDRRTTR